MNALKLAHFMRWKVKESICINALDSLEKHSRTMHIEKDVQKKTCQNNFNSKMRKNITIIRKIHEDAISWDLSIYFHNDHWTLCVFVSGELLLIKIWVNIVLLSWSRKRHQLLIKRSKNSMFVGNQNSIFVQIIILYLTSFPTVAVYFAAKNE